jgi:chemotaxis protein MotB
MSTGKKKGKGGGGGGGGHDAGGMMRWLLTYADMITLLLALFIMLYAMSRVDQGKYQALSAALSKVFGGGSVIVDTGGGGKGVLPNAGTATPSDVQAVKDALEKIGAGLYADFARDGRFAVYLNQKGLTITLEGNAFFDSGKADLKPAMLPLLDAVAERLKAVPNDISVEGFTDSDPIHTAEFPSNWELSYARANRVRAYLEGRGVSAERLIVVGYGETRPLYDNKTAEGKAKNRRVDIVVLRDKQVIDRGQEISVPTK